MKTLGLGPILGFDVLLLGNYSVVAKLLTLVAEYYNGALIRRCPLFLLLLSLSSSPVYAQRVFATVDPSSQGEDLRFDTNDLPVRILAPGAQTVADLNFSPNIVFTADSSRAFVSYPASHKVLVFDAKTGQTVSVIEVGQNPGLITMTPDGTNVAIVCLFLDENLPERGDPSEGPQVGEISIIEVESLEVRTLDLQGVFFSFANNIVFSEDSKTGFVASSGTDEVLRFDVQTAAEITPRIDFGMPVRPSSITMAPDFSFFGVVLVGSSRLSGSEFPDSIQIVDPSLFEVVRSIVPETEYPGFPHNFYATNTLAISSDGTFGVIGDREFSSSPEITMPELTEDHAVLMNLQTGETLAVFDVAGVTGVSVPVPGQKRFVVVSATDLSVIDAESLQDVRLATAIMDFKPTTRPAFSQDGRRMFITSALRDTFLELDMETLSLRRPIDLGPSVELEIDGVQFTVPSAPMDTVLSPDQEVLAVLKFNANTIELVKDTQQFFIPRLQSTSVWFTGVALTNNSLHKAEVIATGVHRTGVPFVDENETEDIVELVNPQVFNLDPGQQLSVTVSGLLDAAPGTDIDGWLDFDSDQPQMSSFFLIGDRDVKRMDGGLADFTTSLRSILPEVRTTDGFQTEIFIVNPNNNSTETNIVLFDGSGEIVAVVERDSPARTLFSSPVRNLFGQERFENWQNGYVEVSSEKGLLVFEMYYDDERMAALNAIPVQDTGELPTSFYVPQFVVSPDYESFINWVNVGDQKATLLMSLRGDAGEELVPEVMLEIEPGQLLRNNVAQLFNLTDEETEMSGWMLIESDVAGVVGNSEIQVFGKAITAITTQNKPMDNFIFSHVAEAFGISTGVALLNPGPEPADVEVRVYDTEGTLLGEVVLSLGVHERYVGLLKELFLSLPDMVVGYIRVSASRKIIGLEIFFSHNLDFLAAVPPQPVEPNIGP